MAPGLTARDIQIIAATTQMIMGQVRVALQNVPQHLRYRVLMSLGMSTAASIGHTLESGGANGGAIKSAATQLAEAFIDGVNGSAELLSEEGKPS